MASLVGDLPPIAPSVNQRPFAWLPRCVNAQSLPAVTANNHLRGVPADDFTNTANAVFSARISHCRTFSLAFVGDHGTDANNRTAALRVWALSPSLVRGSALEEWKGEHLLDITLTCGNTAVATGSIFAADAVSVKLVDTISVTVDNSMIPGALASGGTANDAWPAVHVTNTGIYALLFAVNIAGGGGTAMTGLRVGVKEW